MTTLTEVMLDVARLMGIARDGTATGGSTTTLVDTSLGDESIDYAHGAIWFLSGNNSGKVAEITSYSNGTITFSTLLACASGNSYAVAHNKFPLNLIRQAVKYVLAGIEIPKVNTTHTAASGEVTLAGVSNVRRVIVEDERNYGWQEVAGKIYFDDTGTSGSLKIWYIGKHDDLADTGSLDEAVDRQYVIWAAAAYLWRNLVEKINKDNPTAYELLNEAKSNEAAASSMTRRRGIKMMPRDPHYSRWIT